MEKSKSSRDGCCLSNRIIEQLNKNVEALDDEVQDLKSQFQKFKNEIGIRVVRLEERALIFATLGGALMGVASNLIIQFLSP